MSNSELEQRTMYPKMGDDIMQFFAFNHLPEHLQRVSQPFYMMAKDIVQSLPQCPERTVCLRKLLESKDAAVRCMVWKPAS